MCSYLNIHEIPRIFFALCKTQTTGFLQTLSHPTIVNNSSMFLVTVMIVLQQLFAVLKGYSRIWKSVDYDSFRLCKTEIKKYPALIGKQNRNYDFWWRRVLNCSIIKIDSINITVNILLQQAGIQILVRIKKKKKSPHFAELLAVVVLISLTFRHRASSI